MAFGDDKYTYPGSGGVLRNARNICDENELDRATNAYATVAMTAIVDAGAPAAFDYSYLCGIHRLMLSHLYPWAGTTRDVEVLAGGESVRYATVAEMQERLPEYFEELASKEFLCGRDQWSFLRAFGRSWANLTFLHPFRDGNTRSQTAFFAVLAMNAGHPIDWRNVSYEALRNLRFSALRGFPDDMANYLEDRMLPTSRATHWATGIVF